jgi:organic hydroperoxide reductase OsmC/OhrA
MIQYPIEFNSETLALNGVASNWITKSKFKESHLSIPTEFMGPGGALSPEDLFNQALTNCFVATFKVYAENSKLTFANLRVTSKLIVDTDENRKPVMKEFYLEAEIRLPSNPEKALLLAKKASESGFILNSVKTKCHFDFKIV